MFRSFVILQIFILALVLQSEAAAVEEKDCDKRAQLEECVQAPLELALVLDSSSSISRPDYETAKEFLQEFVSQYTIGPDNVRISMITFGQGVYPSDGFDLDAHDTKEGVMAAIAKIPYRGAEYTGTSDGINYVRSVQLTREKVRPGVDKVCVVITDGNSQRYRDTKEAAEEAHEEKITVFAVGVGSAVNQRELINIAAGDEGRVTRVESYNALSSIKGLLLNETCTKKISLSDQECTSSQPTDVNFVFNPASLGHETTTWVTNFISNTVGRKKISDGFQYGVISGSCPDDEGFKLDAYDNVDEIKERLQEYDAVKLPYLVERLAVKGFTTEYGAREDAKSVAVIFAQEGGKDLESLLQLGISGLKENGVQVYVVDPSGAGLDLEDAEILTGESPIELSERFISHLCA